MNREREAIASLIREIDQLDQWRNRVGRRVVALFLCMFVLAVALLVWTATSAHTRIKLSRPAAAKS